MERLIAELQRLYFLPEQQWSERQPGTGDSPAFTPGGMLTPAILGESLAGKRAVALNLTSTDGLVRAMVVNFRKSADWTQAAMLLQAIQDELELPEPALSVSGREGYCVWFSLAEATPLARVSSFLEALRQRYLADLSPRDVRLLPADDQGLVTPVPAFHPSTEKWSAFIQPSMGAMFADAPGLEMAPNPDRQADALAGLRSIGRREFEGALERLETHPETVESSLAARPPSGGEGMLAAHYADPKTFLLAVMNEPAAGLHERIRAAKALLPYFPRND